MSTNRTRNNCRKEPAKYVPTFAEVQVCDIPDNFPDSCKKMIGATYTASIHIDRRGKTWYKILKDLVFGESDHLGINFAFQKPDPEKVSFKNRKYIALPARYCN